MRLICALWLHVSSFGQSTIGRPEHQEERIETVRGKVTDSVTGAPIPGAIVSTGQSWARTDANGSFEISANRSGSLNASAQGYEPSWGNADRALKLTPLAAVAGRVIDSDGEPLPGMNVELLALELTRRSFKVRVIKSVRTDDRGVYRIGGITPGDFYVRVLGRSRVAGSAGPLTPETLEASAAGIERFGARYHPGVEEGDQASTLTLAAGATATADFVLPIELGYAVQGRIVGLAKSAHMKIDLLRNGREPVGTLLRVNRETGSFTLNDVPSGDYLLRVSGQEGSRTLLGETRLLVSKKPIGGVDVVLRPPVQIRMEWVSDRGACRIWPEDLEPEALTWSDRPATPLGTESMTRGDSSLLTISAPPGRYRLLRSPACLMTAARFRDVDMRESAAGFLSDDPESIRVELKWSPNVNIVLPHKEGSLDYVGARIIILPDRSPLQADAFELASWKAPIASSGSISMTGESDRITGQLALPPGRYLFWAMKRPFAYWNPSVLEAQTSRATRVTVEAGVTTVKLNWVDAEK